MSYVQLVEAGRQDLTLTSLAKFARILNIDPADLLTKPQPLGSTPGRPRKSDIKLPPAVLLVVAVALGAAAARLG